MPRKFFSRFSGRFDPEKEYPWYLKPFKFLLTHPVYFTSGRRSISGGIALGIFVGLLPIPGQTALALLMGLLLRVNLPMAVISVWISNPITFVPIFYFAYRIGAMLLNVPVETMPAEASISWLTDEIALRWRPLAYGSLLLATSVASFTYLLTSTIWHVLTIQRYKRRHSTRALMLERYKRKQPKSQR
jgi:uncharacterized protein (DUF2062 family)